MTDTLTVPAVRPDVAERIGRGAAWLDRRQPGWHERIDLGRLDLGDSCLCVLGQVFARAAFENDDYSGFDYATDHLGVDDYQLGFNIRSRDILAQPTQSAAEDAEAQAFAELGTAWKLLIAARREGESR